MKEVAGENFLALKGKAPSHCPYCLRWSKGEICRCPTNYALYNHSSAMKKGMDVGAVIFDENGLIINANRWMEIIVGAPVKSIVGTNILTSFPKQAFKFIKPYYEKVKKTQKCQRYENISVVGPAGRQIYLSGWLIPQITKDEVVRMVCTVEDVTKSKIYVPSSREAKNPAVDSNPSEKEELY